MTSQMLSSQVESQCNLIQHNSTKNQFNCG